MKDEYDLFEKFPDGSSLWRDSVFGFEIARLRLQELAQRSENEFHGINLTTGDVLRSGSKRDAHGFRARLRTERQSNRQAA